MEDCIFCKIVKGEIASTKLYEDDNVLGFLDIAPASKGHTLVITKKHYETLLDVPADELAALVKAVQSIAKAVQQATGAAGFNILQSNNKVAGQVIAHVHFHIIPRNEGDGLSFAWQHGKPEAEELQQLAAEIKKKL